MARIPIEDAGGPEVCAFLDMIAISEMTQALLDVSDDGYNVLVGSTPKHPNLFSGYEKHPGKFIYLPKLDIKSSAAGRYQFLYKTWQALQKSLGLPDFSPVSQDKGCIELINERGGIPYIKQGRIELAVVICSQTWASLPGAGYGQHENRLQDLLGEYAKALTKYRPDFSNVIS